MHSNTLHNGTNRSTVSQCDCPGQQQAHRHTHTLRGHHTCCCLASAGRTLPRCRSHRSPSLHTTTEWISTCLYTDSLNESNVKEHHCRPETEPQYVLFTHYNTAQHSTTRRTHEPSLVTTNHRKYRCTQPGALNSTQHTAIIAKPTTALYRCHHSPMPATDRYHRPSYDTTITIALQTQCLVPQCQATSQLTTGAAAPALVGGLLEAPAQR
jgi:hypothetical protein